MKSTNKLIIIVLTLLALAASAYAQSPREQLQQMVEQLQKTPDDNALREKIIKLAPTLKPSPAVPDTAVAFEGRAQFAFRNAKSENDFLVAAQEYEKAVVAAPWVSGYYADLCTIYEKAGKFEEARRHCGFFLTGLTDPAQMTDVKRRIAGLEFGIEKANSPEAKASKLAAITAAATEQERRRPSTEGEWVESRSHIHVIRKNETFTVVPGSGGMLRGAWRPIDIEVSRQRVRFGVQQPGCPQCGVTHYDVSLSASGDELTGTFYGSDGGTYPARWTRKP